jgi:hypothetical protein
MLLFTKLFSSYGDHSLPAILKPRVHAQPLHFKMKRRLRMFPWPLSHWRGQIIDAPWLMIPFMIKKESLSNSSTAGVLERLL